MFTSAIPVVGSPIAKLNGGPPAVYVPIALKYSQSLVTGNVVVASGKLPNIILTTQLFVVLFLAQNPGKVFSKEQILNAVWGVDMFIEMNTVAVHINRLREKIERSSANPEYILTVWGIGYKFTDG